MENNLNSTMNGRNIGKRKYYNHKKEEFFSLKKVAELNKDVPLENDVELKLKKLYGNKDNKWKLYLQNKAPDEIENIKLKRKEQRRKRMSQNNNLANAAEYQYQRRKKIKLSNENTVNVAIGEETFLANVDSVNSQRVDIGEEALSVKSQRIGEESNVYCDGHDSDVEDPVTGMLISRRDVTTATHYSGSNDAMNATLDCDDDDDDDDDNDNNNNYNNNNSKKRQCLRAMTKDEKEAHKKHQSAERQRQKRVRDGKHITNHKRQAHRNRKNQQTIELGMSDDNNNT
jgi:hypothetical protein